MRVFLPAILALAFAPAALPAQEVVQPLPGTTDADRLAEQMRALASNPRDVNALVAAGDLSLKLDDLSGAASLFARAEKVAPADPRIKAGEGAILVRSERPGEALRYFAQAEAGGLDARTFAADRGLAYDLVGQQERAQRDYRLALKTAPSDEIVRRYALSLGISGKRQEALDALDPLLRKQDRSAWRTRAFVLAMGGDQAGAEKIAATMLPGGMAQGLQPFFQRLPTLPAADRAFAVHFGEVRATPERIADARLAPAMPYLAPEPSAAPVALAAATTPVVGKPVQRGNRRERQRPGRVQMVAATPAPVTPSYTEATRALASVQPVPASTGAVTLAAATVPVAPVSAVPAAALSSSGAPTPTQPVTVQPAPVVQPAPARVASVQPSVARAVVSQPSTVVATPSPRQAQPVVSAPQQPTQFAAASVTQPLPATATVQPIPRPASPAYAGSMGSPANAGSTVSPAAPAPVATTAAVTPGTVAAAPAAATPAPASAAPRPATRGFAAQRRRDETDAVLARIVAGLSIPGSELGVTEPARPLAVVAAPAAPAAVPAETAARVLAEAKAKEQRDAEAQKALAAKALADKRAADRKAAADKKALAAKKAAEAEKLAEAKEAAEEKRKARANPSRIWVQVAGGANEDDLPKAWAAAKAKAPTLAGKSGWKTPLRATNRVLTGPFKTDAEARAFVNKLTKEGVGAFTFTSDAGQVVEKLSSK